MLEHIRVVFDRWKRRILYVTLLFALVTVYGGHFFGPWRDKVLPAAIAAAFTILMEAIFTISRQVESQLDSVKYGNIHDAMPKIIELLKATHRGRQPRVLKIIAGSGASTIVQLDRVLNETTSPLVIHLHIINPDGPLAGLLPPHWLAEACTTLLWLSQRAEANSEDMRRLVVECSLYDHIPCVRGVLLDDQHLFLSFFKWETVGARAVLSGAKEPHTYYCRKPVYENEFQLFTSWHTSAPRHVVPQLAPVGH